MSDFVIVTGDTVMVTFAAITIAAAASPQPLTGTSKDLSVGGLPVCVEGDELPMSLKVPLSYVTPQFPISGTGSLKLFPVKGMNTTTVLTDGGKALLLKGAVFQAVFTITSPASSPKGPDSTDPRTGTASFTTANSVLTAD
jgi:hypothetical protein